MIKIKLNPSERKIIIISDNAINDFTFSFGKDLFCLSKSDLLDCSPDEDWGLRMTEDTAEKVLDLLAEERKKEEKMNYENYCETPIELRDAGIDSVPEIVIDNDILHASVRNIKTLSENIEKLGNMLSTLRDIQRLQYVKLSIADVKFPYRLISIEKDKSEGIIFIRVNHGENVWTKIGVDGKIEDLFSIENKIQELKSYYQGWYDFWTSKTGSLIEPDLKEF